MAWEKPPGRVLDTMRWCGGRRRAAAAPIRPDGGSACCCFAGCFALLRHRNEVIALADSCLFPKTSALATTSSVFHNRHARAPSFISRRTPCCMRYMIRTTINLWRLESSGDGLVRCQLRDRGKVCYSVKVKWAMTFSAHQVCDQNGACAAAYLGLCLFVMVRERHACADIYARGRSLHPTALLLGAACM